MGVENDNVAPRTLHKMFEGEFVVVVVEENTQSFFLRLRGGGFDDGDLMEF